MKIYQLAEFKGGWIVGDFAPTIVTTQQFEVAVKHYPAGSQEPMHHHKIADEITVIVSGRAKMNGVIFESGSVIHLSPGDSTDFEAIEETVTVVVKHPSLPTDKYLDMVVT